MANWKRDCGRKEKALDFSTFNIPFSSVFEQGTLHSHFALGPTNYEAGTDWEGLIIQSDYAKTFIF